MYIYIYVYVCCDCAAISFISIFVSYSLNIPRKRIVGVCLCKQERLNSWKMKPNGNNVFFECFKYEMNFVAIDVFNKMCCTNIIMGFLINLICFWINLFLFCLFFNYICCARCTVTKCWENSTMNWIEKIFHIYVHILCIVKQENGTLLPYVKLTSLLKCNRYLHNICRLF